MSFSTTVKNELARLKASGRCCKIAELAALARMDGIIQISGAQRTALHIYNENAAVARKIFTYVKELFDVQADILVRRKVRLKKNNVYAVRIQSPEKIRTILDALGLMETDGQLTEGIREGFIKKDCCRRAFLRGVFLGGGSVNDPEGTYHLEITTNDEQLSHDICRLLKKYGLPAKVSGRKNWFVVYLKGSEEIVNLLNVMGAHAALLNFENVRIYKDMRNRVNRIVNCETANLNKTVNAAMKQVEDIKYIDEAMGLRKLPGSLREVAELRLQFPDTSLKELGEMLTPRVGKSGVNHRLRRLSKIADDLRARRL